MPLNHNATDTAQARPGGALKVLLLAYECSPYHGSERGVGWGRLLQASRVAETHVITSASSHADLERAHAEGLLPANVCLHTPALPPDLHRRLTARGRFDYDYRAYRRWQRYAFDLARKQQALHCFDVVHQATVCTFREPGYGWQLGIPFLWGPFGGTQNFPWRMLPVLPLRHALYEAARGLLNVFMLWFSPHVRSAARHADAILGANSANVRHCTRAFGRPVEQVLETAIARAPEPDQRRYQHRLEMWEHGEPLPPLRLLWSGQLTPRKALPLLLHALASLKDGIAFTLDVIGSGPEALAWQQLTHELHLQEVVRFHGRLPLAQAVAAMDQADVLCFSSLRDTSGNVVLEALAAGVPIIAFDHQGAADMVSPHSGILIPVTTPRAAIAAWAKAVQSLALDPARLLRLSEGAHAQACNFLWNDNGDRINGVYRRLAHKRGTPPQDRELATGGWRNAPAPTSSQPGSNPSAESPAW